MLHSPGKFYPCPWFQSLSTYCWLSSLYLKFSSFSHVLETCIDNLHKGHLNTTRLKFTIKKAPSLSISSSIVNPVMNSLSQVKSLDFSLDRPIFLTQYNKSPNPRKFIPWSYLLLSLTDSAQIPPLLSFLPGMLRCHLTGSPPFWLASSNTQSTYNIPEWSFTLVSKFRSPA